MNDKHEGFTTPRQAVLPPLSSRTLYHPSFLPLYMAAGSVQHPMDCSSQTVLPIIPSEFFYTDPTVGGGGRIPNIVSELRVFECFRLNTPPPVMSTCPAPANRPDPFGSGPHPTRDLGGPTWRMEPALPPVAPGRVVLQLTQEEDQAITNLLKLHHQVPRQTHGDGALIAPQKDPPSVGEALVHNMDMDPTSVEEMDELLHSDGQYPWTAFLESRLHQGRLWSDIEIEAANTLLTRLSLLEETGLWNRNQRDRLPLEEGSSMSTGTQRASESSPPSISSYGFDPVQKNLGYTNFGCASSFARGNGEPAWVDPPPVEGGNAGDGHLLSCEEHRASFLPASSSSPPSSLSSDSEVESGPSAFGGLLGAREGMLTESEGTAVHALLSLRDPGAPGALQ